MKKWLSGLLVMCLMISLIGCGAEKSDERDKNDKQNPGVTENQDSVSTDVDPQESPLKIRTNHSTVASCDGTVVVVKTDGSVWAWGNNEDCQVTYVPGAEYSSSDRIKKTSEPQHIMDGAVAVGVGSAYCVALKADGTLWLWGHAFELWDYDKNPDFGSTQEEFCTPICIMEDVATFSAGWRHLLAVKTDGTLWGLGFTMDGQVNWIPPETRSGPITTPIQLMADCVAVAAGGEHSYCIKKDGTMWGWGSSRHSLLADTSAEYRGFNEPRLIMKDVVYMDAGTNTGYAITSDNVLWGWGCGRYNEQCPCWDKNFPPEKVLEDVRTVSVNSAGEFAVAVKNDGTVWGWGDVSSGYNIHNNLGILDEDMKEYEYLNTSNPYYSQSEHFVFGAIQMPIEGIVHAVAGNHGCLLVAKDGTLYGTGNDGKLTYKPHSDVVTYKDGIYGAILEDIAI